MKGIKKHISVFSAVSLAVFLVSLALFITSELSSRIADTLNVTVCAFFRQALATVTNPLPFSLFEVLVMLLPVIIGLAVFFAVRRILRGTGILRYFVSLCSTVFLLLSLYWLTIGISYNTTPLAHKLGIEPVEVNGDSLASTLERLVNEVNALSEELTYVDGGYSDPGYSLDGISERVLASYEKFTDTQGLSAAFYSRAKPMLFSPVMTMLRLTGIYFPFTGESNVNTLYPPYDLCFTAAHELSHQRGILRENEANFMAFLLCYTSDDPYLRYSGALNILSYVSSALYRTDADRYYGIIEGLCDGARYDLTASSRVSEKYENSFLADLSDSLNDWFLKSNGTQGVVSYGMVVELAVAYLAE